MAPSIHGPCPQVPFYFSSDNIVARSPILKLANPNEPTQGHLAATNVSGWAPRTRLLPRAVL